MLFALDLIDDNLICPHIFEYIAGFLKIDQIQRFIGHFYKDIDLPNLTEQFIVPRVFLMHDCRGY
ncbi:hypothetical protein METH109765_23810 [Mesobacillus thioparans]